jgi:hypothetical protein
MKRTAAERALDYQLVTRAQERLFANGLEANRLRALLLTALVDAAQLAGDKEEARALGAQLDQLARTCTPYSGSR